MSEAISALCRTFGLDDVPSGSSPQSRLRALGSHVRSRLRGALHHGVRRAFAILASHYDVDLERVSEGYCLPDDEDAALCEAQRLNPCDWLPRPNCPGSRHALTRREKVFGCPTRHPQDCMRRCNLVIFLVSSLHVWRS
jgi:hypothetical protein